MQQKPPPNNGMQRSADTTALIYGKGAARPLMPGVMLLRVSQMNRLAERQRTMLFSPLLILAALYAGWAVACTYEENTKVSLDGNNPPTFRLSGSGHQVEFAVSEVHPDNHVPPAYRNPDKNIELWKIVPEAEPAPKAWDYPQIAYGNVPRGFRQELPKGGAPPALVEGKTYEAGGAAYGANGGSVLFTIRDSKAVTVPKPNNR